MAAGLGFKTFNTGDVLSAADVNGYLMQGVLVFANATARDAAITSPQEGQCCYLKDTDAVQTYSGSAWVGFDDSNAIQNSIVDAKGDIVAASGNDTPARLAVGNNGETLVADSSTTTGLRYQAIQTRNCVYNSQMEVWQRGTSFTAIGYVADRWYFSPTGVSGRTVTRQAGTGQFQYVTRVARDSGNTNTAVAVLGQSFEIADATPYAGKTVTLSFYARAGANYSPASGVLNAYVFSGTSSTEANRVTTAYASGGATASSLTVNLTTTLTRYQTTFTFGASVTQFCIEFDSGTFVGTAGAADYFEVTGVQLEVGSIATNYVRQGATIQGELAACQRYYYRIGGTGPTERLGFGTSTSTTNAEIVIPAKSSFRTAPTAVDFSSLQTFDGVNVTAITTVALTGNASGKEYGVVSCGVASGLAQFRPVEITATSTSGYIGFSAEL